jgi:endonuclease-3
MKPAVVEELFRCLEKAIPSPTTELEYTNPFTLLCAVVMSAQMTDSGVNRATKPLFKVADSPKKMVKLGEEKLREYIKSINFNNTKAKNVIALSQKLIDLHGGEVPRSRDELEALPGVGRKTANVILNTAFGEKTIAVDTHVLRVSNRTGLAKGETPDAVEAKLMRVVPDKYRQDAHHLLILHGRYMCKAKKPDCPRCPIVQVCEYKAKTTIASPSG